MRAGHRGKGCRLADAACHHAMDGGAFVTAIIRARVGCIGGMNRKQQSKDKAEKRAHRGRLAERFNNGGH